MPILRSISSLQKRLAPLIAVGAFICLFVLATRHGSTLNRKILFQNPQFLATGFGACLLTIALGFISWCFLLSRRGKGIGILRGYRLYTISSINRYLPGGQLWQYVGLASHAEDRETGTWAIVAYAQATLCSLFAGALLCLFSLQGWLNYWKLWHSAIGLGLAAIGFMIATSPRWQLPLCRILRKRYPTLPETHFLRRSESAVMITIGIIAWSGEALAGNSFYWILKGTTDWSLFWFIYSSYAVSTLAAYFSFITPAGLGIREGLFVAFLSTRLSVADASFIALGARFMLLIADAFFTLPILGVLFHERSTSRRLARI